MDEGPSVVPIWVFLACGFLIHVAWVHDSTALTFGYRAARRKAARVAIVDGLLLMAGMVLSVAPGWHTGFFLSIALLLSLRSVWALWRRWRLGPIELELKWAAHPFLWLVFPGVPVVAQVDRWRQEPAADELAQLAAYIALWAFAIVAARLGRSALTSQGAWTGAAFIRWRGIKAHWRAGRGDRPLRLMVSWWGLWDVEVDLPLRRELVREARRLVAWHRAEGITSPALPPRSAPPSAPGRR